MKKKLSAIAVVVLTAVIAACPASTSTKPPPPALGLPKSEQTAISKVDGSQHEHEPSIAVSKNGHTIVSFLAMSSAGYTVGYRISNDFGDTWGDATLFPMPDGENTQANASVAVDDDDNVYMAWAAEEHTVSGRSNQHVFLAKAKKNATTLDAPEQLDDSSEHVAVYDLIRVFVTKSGVVHVTYLKEGLDGAAFLVDAHDGKRDVVAGPGSAGSFRNFSRMCEANRLYLVYADSDAATFSGDLGVVIRASDDDGNTWSDATTIAMGDDELVNPGFGIDCVARGDDVFVTYSTSRDTNLGSTAAGGGVLTEMPPLDTLRIAHSHDGAKTFDPTIVDYEDAHVGARFMYPIVVADDDGIDVAYYAHGNADDAHGLLVASRSTDAGATFSAATTLHDGVVLETNRTLSTWGGDYIGRAFRNGAVFVAYTNNATSAPHIDLVRIPVDDIDAQGTSIANVLQPIGAQGCYVDAAFTPSTWAPPTDFAPNACTQAQLSAYMACVNTGDCASFRADTANASCLSCVETDVSATKHGPVLTTTDATAGIVPIAFNYGGCQAHFDGLVDETGCGAVENAENDCVNAECDSCADFSSPSEGGATYDCYFTAIDVGACSAHRTTNACINETAPGGIAQSCVDVSAFLPLWCGPSQ